MFVYTIGDILGIAIFLLIVIFSIAFITYTYIRTRFCKHAYERAKVFNHGPFYINGYRCKKCGTETTNQDITIEE